MSRCQWVETLSYGNSWTAASEIIDRHLLFHSSSYLEKSTYWVQLQEWFSVFRWVNAIYISGISKLWRSSMVLLATSRSNWEIMSRFRHLRNLSINLRGMVLCMSHCHFLSLPTAAYIYKYYSIIRFNFALCSTNYDISNLWGMLFGYLK